MKMFKEIVFLLLLLGYVSIKASTTHVPEKFQSRHSAATEVHITTAGYKNQTEGSKGFIVHPLSGPVVAVIVFAAIGGIIGIILFVSFMVRRLTTKSNM